MKVNISKLVVSSIAAIIISKMYECVSSQVTHEDKMFHEVLILIGAAILVLNIR